MPHDTGKLPQRTSRDSQPGLEKSVSRALTAVGPGPHLMVGTKRILRFPPLLWSGEAAVGSRTQGQGQGLLE